ncbi:Gti1/Pac2 family-domain-containing protein [Mycena amicta]|nr:Gti1/Pac2 family-domain-containing protein [Mycena amicta]
MSFRPGLQQHQPQPGPCLTHPSLHIRHVADAHKVLEAVRLNILPLIRRRLLAHERAQLRSGNVFVWEECEDVDEGGLVRWTEGRRWSQSRMRGDYLFYEEKVETTSEEKQAKAARRASKASDSSSVLPPPPKRKDRPAKQDGLTKQTYSVSVRLPGPDAATRKWHIVAYFSTADYALLPVVDHYDYLRNLRVPDGIFMSSRMPVPCDNGRERERLPSSAYSDETDSNSNSTRASHSPAPASPSFELVAPRRSFSSPGPYHTSSSTANANPYALPPPEMHRGTSSASRVSLPPLSSLGYPTPRPLLVQRHSSSQHTRLLSPEDRRLLDSLRVAL